MKIDLRNFFKYYDDNIFHQQEAVKKLEEALGEQAPSLLDDASEWVEIYRNKPEPQPETHSAILAVPFYPQTDNYKQPNRTCNSSACAMCLEYFRPGTLKGSQGDDQYLKKVFAIGDTTDHNVQTQVLQSYGVKSAFNYNLSFEILEKELEEGRPVVAGILHRGSLSHPTGGHMIVVRGINDKGQFVCNDPYGDLYDGYTGNVYKGKGVIYERHVMEARWLPEGPNSGWGRTFDAKVEATKTERGTLPEVGVNLIKEFEGLHLSAYNDPLSGGLPITIGWGSTKDIDGSRFELGDKISEEKAELLLRQQLKYNYLDVLENTVPYWDEMNSNQHGALLSFAYNLGAHFYGGHNFQTITRVLKNKEWDRVPDALYLYRNPGTNVEKGLARRREAEGALWNS